jgi:glycosyltransferase involved in cell wall biosynthesis
MRGQLTRPIRVAHVATIDLTLKVLLGGQLRRLRAEGFDVTGISAPGPAADSLAAEGIHHIAWPHATRAWDLRSDVRAFGELIGILRRGRFDIVHTHNPKPGVMGRWAASLVGVPIVVNTVHGFYATPDDILMRKAAVLALEWMAARASDLELYQSQEDLAWARRLRIARADRGRLLGNGADLSRFDPRSVSDRRRLALRRELGIPKNVLVVGTVGRLVAEKGYPELIAAARRVREVMPSVVFVAVGGRDIAKADALSGGVLADAAKDVKFLGWRDDVRDLISVMDVFVLASRREGLARSAIEAAAMGKPLVLTNIRGCREIVRDRVDGFLVAPGNVAHLFEAIMKLARDDVLRMRMGAAARDGAVERYDEEKVSDRVVHSYRELLGRKGIGSRPTAQRRSTHISEELA